MKLLDNVGANRLGDALASSIDEGAKLSIISAYFTVFAYKELKDELSKIDGVRFLFSEPTFIKTMESAKDPRQFELERRGRERGVGGVGLELTLRNNLDQRAIARECAEWIRSKGLFRSARQRGMIQPGGTYVVENPDGTAHGFMGASAAFTQEGLGYEHRPGTVTGVSHFEDTAETVGLKAMFESVWNNPEMVEDVTERVAEQVETLYRENPPEFIYFLTLYHLFRDYMEDEEDNGIRSGLYPPVPETDPSFRFHIATGTPLVFTAADGTTHRLIYGGQEDVTLRQLLDYIASGQYTPMTPTPLPLAGLYLFGSYDCRRWALLGGREAPGTLRDTGCLAARADCRYFRLLFASKLCGGSLIERVDISASSRLLARKMR